ncbi:MAG: YcfL family protein [Deltaproteobacteria bacterium]|nr:YcfL family protein [Deltaproteobacteria bacterium]MBW2420331.1 YcfL family protein [Deltaproteobacteria bacterium]
MLGGAAAVLLASQLGCASASAPHVQDTSNVVVDHTYPRAKLVLGSKDLLGKVVIIDPKFRKTGSLTEASVSVQNLSQNTYNLEYRFEWEDDDGFEVDGGGIWTRFSLTPNLIKKIRATGPSPQATRITFTVRYPHTSS